ncbi:MAG: hypothetical protein JXQ72_05290 [Anaerolineae bacterium]|nr:hypothetical protein [Anaerolineae bacterium]
MADTRDTQESRAVRSGTRAARWMARIDRLPRMVRVLLSLGITLELVALVWVVLAELFGIEPLDPNPDNTTAPLLLTVLAGVALYAVGWWALVGFDLDPAEPWQAGCPAVRYMAAGVVCLIVLALLVLYGLAMRYSL